MSEPLHDPLFDPVEIVEFAIRSGIFDVMYSQWGWPIVEIIHFTGLCLLIGAVGSCRSACSASRSAPRVG